MKISPVAAELFHADGHDEAFRNFTNALKNRPTFYSVWLHVSANMAVIRRSCYRNIQRKAESCFLHSVVVLINSVTA